MPNKSWILATGRTHCESCLAAAKQIHPESVWHDAGIYPKSPRLFCTHNCNCYLEDTDQEEFGDINEIPIKGVTMQEFQSKFVSDCGVDDQGNFEIIPISAGIGNGWNFSEKVLQESLAMWNEVEVFIDHSTLPHSVRDLAGLLHSPSWDPQHKGIRCNLKAIGPSSGLLKELANQMLTGGDHRPRVGFSADVLFTADKKNVTRILKVYSVDLVFNPARGGVFLRALNQIAVNNPQWATLAQQYKGVNMDETLEKLNQDPPEVKDPKEQTNELAKTRMQALSAEQKRQDTLREEQDKAHVLLQAQCNILLDSSLAASKLPATVADRVRKQFKDQVFEPAELTSAIDDARTMVSELMGDQTVKGPRIQAMFNNVDQVIAAIHDMLGADRPEQLKSLKPSPLTGIRELYHLMTGDYGFQGGYFPERAQFSVASDLPGVLKNAMNKLIVMRWEDLGRAGYRWWEPVVSVQHFNSLHDITGVLVGEVNLLPAVSEGAAYTALDVIDSPETASFAKYGGYIGLTLEMFEKDETHKLIEYPKKLASSALRKISALVSAVFTTDSDVGPHMADSYNVFEAAHHANLGTTALASAEWDVACKAIYNQSLPVYSGGTAAKLALDAKYCLVPRALRLTAQQILYPSFAHEANYFSENQQRGEMGDVIVVPDWTDANNWAAVADPRLAPAIIVAERFGLMPELFIANNELNGALFTNDEIRMKARLFTAVLVADYRPMYKENVA